MRLFILLGLIGLSFLMSSTASAACTKDKFLPLLVEVSVETDLGGNKVVVKQPKLVEMISNKCVLEVFRDIIELETQKRELMEAYDLLVGPSGAMVNYCKTLSGDKINTCFTDHKKAAKALSLLVEKARALYWSRHDEIKAEEEAAKKAAQFKASKDAVAKNKKNLEEARKVLEAFKSLK
jgi:hypothetical protein